MSDANLCPTCKQPMPREATTRDPHGVELQCEFCAKRAAFIIRKKAVFYDCRGRA